MEIVEYDRETGAPIRLNGEYARDDLDLAGPGIVKILENRYGETYPGLPWEKPPSPHSPATIAAENTAIRLVR